MALPTVERVGTKTSFPFDPALACRPPTLETAILLPLSFRASCSDAIAFSANSHFTVRTQYRARGISVGFTKSGALAKFPPAGGNTSTD